MLQVKVREQRTLTDENNSIMSHLLRGGGEGGNIYEIRAEFMEKKMRDERDGM